MEEHPRGQLRSLILVHGGGVGVGDEAAATTRFIHPSGANCYTFLRLKDAL